MWLPVVYTASCCYALCSLQHLVLDFQDALFWISNNKVWTTSNTIADPNMFPVAVHETISNMLSLAISYNIDTSTNLNL